MRLVLVGVRQIGHKVEQLGVNNEIISPELVLLEGVHVEHLLQTKNEVVLLVQYAYLEENPNDVHMNINRVDPSEVQELVDQMRERESQPRVDMDFQPVDIVHPPPIHVCTGHELRPRGGEGYSDLRREGILPLKGILSWVSNRLELGKNTVSVHA